VNALDAAFVAYAGISALRQQIRPEQRVHGVISGRDWTPNGSFFFSSTPLSFNTPPGGPAGKRKKKGGEARWEARLTEQKREGGRQGALQRNFASVNFLTVIPDYAKMSWSVRADARDALEPLRDRVVHCLEYARLSDICPDEASARLTYMRSNFPFYRSGASATGCRHEVELGEHYLDLRQNPVLGEGFPLFR